MHWKGCSADETHLVGTQPGRVETQASSALLSSAPQGALQGSGAAASASTHIRLVSLRSASVVVAWHHRVPPPPVCCPRRGTGHGESQQRDPGESLWYPTAVISRIKATALQQVTQALLT